MNGSWKKRVPALLMALVMTVSLMPAAQAAELPAEAEHCGTHPNVQPDVRVTKEPTCSETGTRVWTCPGTGPDTCAWQYTETIPATGNHIYGSEGWEPDDNDTTHSQTCTVCKKKISEDHRWGRAYKNGDGHTKVCDLCDFALTTGHNHDPGDPGRRDFTCTTNAATYYKCAECGTEYYTMERLDHVDSDGDGRCDRCKSSVTTGITVTFETNGGGTVPAQTVASGGGLPSGINDPSKSGCEFMGWQETPGALYTGQATLLTSGALSSNRTFTASTTFYAIWRVKAEGLAGTLGAVSEMGPALWSHIGEKCAPYFGDAAYTVTFGSPLPGGSNGTLYLTGAAPVRAGTPYTESDFRYMTFASGSSGTCRLYYTAKDSSGQNTVSGYVDISGQAAAAAVASNYAGDIRYATTGANVQINANDIARFFQKARPGDTLQYVRLTGVPAAGSLYYNYYSASSYGVAGRMEITSANTADLELCLSPASTAQYALTELTYVPSGTGYCASIPFTAYGNTGAGVTGTILIGVTRAQVAEVYGITPRDAEVAFPAASLYTAVHTATGAALGGIQLLELPPAAAGAVYLGSAPADTRTLYAYASGNNRISSLRFVPAAGYTGSVEIPYAALDANGTAMAWGTFALGVLSSRRTLSDVTASTWCYKYVMELVDRDVISGYADGSFKPNSTVTYGAALKLILLAAGYPEQAPTGDSVFSGYLSRAQADGIITRSDVDLTAPITRLQVAQLAAGALKLDTASLSSVKPFTDTSDVYVQALNAAGIVEGYFSNGTSTFRPGSTLTRGQMSAIVWRMNQYRK